MTDSRCGSTDGTMLSLPVERDSQDWLDGATRRSRWACGRSTWSALRRELRPGLVRYTAAIELVQPTGSRTYATFKLGGAAVVAELQAHDVSQPGETIELAIDMNRVVLMDPATELVVS